MADRRNPNAFSWRSPGSMPPTRPTARSHQPDAAVQPVPVRRRPGGPRGRAHWPGGGPQPGGGHHSRAARGGTSRACQDDCALARTHAERGSGSGHRAGFTAAQAKSGAVRADAGSARPVSGADRGSGFGGSICRSVSGSACQGDALNGAIGARAVSKAISRAVRAGGARKAIGGANPSAVTVGDAVTSRVRGASPDGGAIEAGASRANVTGTGTSAAGSIGDAVTCRVPGASPNRGSIQAGAVGEAGTGRFRAADPLRGTFRPGAVGPALLGAVTGRARTAGRSSGAGGA
jgi:hypothetical protein